MSKKRNSSYSNFICQDCECSIPLPRMKSEQREKGHIKDIWCPNCKKISKMKEYRIKDFYKNMNGEIL